MAILGLVTIKLLPVLVRPGEETGGEGTGARAAHYLLSIAPGNTTRSVNTSLGQYYAQYGFQLENTRDGPLPMVNLTLYPWSFTTWSCLLVPSVPFEIDPGDNKTILQDPLSGEITMAGRYNFQIRGVESCPRNTISIKLGILPWVTADIKPPVPKPAYPGDTVEPTSTY
ncbi:MAG: hypothetical protein QXH42_03755 [Thermoplasmata archaeon]